MADWHLKELRDEIEQRGWRITVEHPGDDYSISATWEIQRSSKLPTIFIDFEGLDDMVCLPIEQSYGCHIRGQKLCGLYFGRRGEGRSQIRQAWKDELTLFIQTLDKGKGE